MKSLLSENMLRFGTKNLSESSKRALTLESIMQTIHENGLASAVKSRLDEAFAANYWFTKSQDLSTDTNYAYDITPSGAWNNIFGIGKNFGTIFVQVPKTAKTLADVDAALKRPDGIGIQFEANGPKKGPTAVEALSSKKSWYTGKDKYGKPYAYGVNVTPNTIYQALLVTIGNMMGISA